MAYENECDLILSLLEIDGSKSIRPLGEFVAIFRQKKLNLANREIIAIFTILQDRGHIQIHESMQIIPGEESDSVFGALSITIAGSAFINTSGYVKEKESRMLQADLAQSNLLMVEFAKKQYIANFCIAIGTCLVGAYTFFQMFDYYEHHNLSWKSFSYFLSGFVLGLLLWLVSTQLKKILSKQKSE